MWDISLSSVMCCNLFAMNGTPLHITVSIGVSEKYSVEDIENLYSGINKACSKYNVDVIGGDISSSFSGLVITITIVGHKVKILFIGLGVKKTI